MTRQNLAALLRRVRVARWRAFKWATGDGPRPSKHEISQHLTDENRLQWERSK